MPETVLTKANQDAKLEALHRTAALLLGKDGHIVHEELCKFNDRMTCLPGYKLPAEVKLRAAPLGKVPEPAMLHLFDPKIIVPATTTKLIPKESFVVNVHNRRDPLPREGILIREIGIGFKQFLMDKDEEAQDEQILCSYDLLQDTLLGGIKLALGEKVLYTTLTSLRFLLMKQQRGQPGYLKNSGTHNAYLMRGIEKRLTRSGTYEKIPVDVIAKASWDDEDRGWKLNAAKAGHNTPQTERIRFFFLNLAEQPSEVGDGMRLVVDLTSSSVGPGSEQTVQAA